MLDLNDPRDAWEYIRRWAVSQGDVGPRTPEVLKVGTEDELLHMAMQLFLYADKRQPAGIPGEWH